METLKSLQARLDDRTQRERGILMFAIIAVTIFVWDFLLMQPLAFTQQNIVAQTQVSNAELNALFTQAEQIGKAGTQNPNIAKKTRLKRLQGKLKKLEAELVQTMDQLVPPREMSKLLEMLLRRAPRLELRKVQSLGSQPLNSDSNEPGTNDTVAMENAPVSNVFRHGLRIEFDGDFPGTLDYLKTLEGLKWKFFWDKIDYQVDEYPISSVAITVFTISTNEHWIGP